MTKEQYIKTMSQAMGVMKQVAGIGNNAAWLVCLEAWDHIQKHPACRGKAKQWFKLALQHFKDTEAQLVNAQKNRLFHVDDMPAEVRKRYGDITDREYYEMWTGIGAAAYMRTRPMVTSLANKFRLEMEASGDKHPVELGWAFTAWSALNLACSIVRREIEVIVHEMFGPLIVNDSTQREHRRVRNDVSVISSQLQLDHVRNAWLQGIEELYPNARAFLATLPSKRNIVLGLDQLEASWIDADTMIDSMQDVCQQFDDMWRTRGEMKKAMREIEELREA